MTIFENKKNLTKFFWVKIGFWAPGQKKQFAQGKWGGKKRFSYPHILYFQKMK